MLPDKLFNKNFVPCITPADSWYEDTSVHEEPNKSIHYNILKSYACSYPKEDEKIELRNMKSPAVNDVSNTRLRGLKAISLKMTDPRRSEVTFVPRPFPLQTTRLSDHKTNKRERRNSIIDNRKLKTGSMHNIAENEINPSPNKNPVKTKTTNVKENAHKTSAFTSKLVSRNEKLMQSVDNKPPKTPLGPNKRISQDVGLKAKLERNNKIHESQLNDNKWNNSQIQKKFIAKKSVQQNYNKYVKDGISLNNKIDVKQAPFEKYNPPPSRGNVKWIDNEHQSSNNQMKLFKHSDLRTEDATFLKEKQVKVSTNLKKVLPYVPPCVPKNMYDVNNKEQQIYRVVLGNEKVNLNKIVSDLFDRNGNNVIVITKDDQFKQLACKTSSMDYIKFAEDITTDIIANKMYSDTSIRDIFKKHFELNRDLLDEDKMTAEITALKAALSITESNKSLINSNESTETMSQVCCQKSEDVVKNTTSNHPMEGPLEANKLSKLRLAKSFNSFLLQGYELDFRSKNTKNAYLKYRDTKKEEMRKLISKQQSIIRVYMQANISDDSNHSRIDKSDTENEISTTDTTNKDSTTTYDEETDHLSNTDESVELLD